MKRISSQILTIALLLLVTYMALGNSSRYGTKSIMISDLKLEYTSDFKSLNLSSFTASQVSFSIPLNKEAKKLKLSENGSAYRAILDCPGNITVDGDPDSCGAVVTWTAPTTDSPLYEIEQVSGPASGSLFAYRSSTDIEYEEQFVGTNTPTGETCTFTVTVLDRTAPTITLTGDNPQIIEACDSYTELGAIATDPCIGDLSGNLVINTSAVNTAVVGTYIVRYNIRDGSGNVGTQVTRTVNVVDTTLPTITLNSPNPQIIEVCGTYNELGATASDTCFGDLTGSIVVDASAVNTAVVGSYSVTYNVTDIHSNAAIQVSRTVNVVDTSDPILSLVGANPQTLEACDTYIELGATANDACYGDISGSIVVDTSAINTAVVGSYLVTYNVTDANNNAAIQLTRTVNVVDTTDPVPNVISLPNIEAQCAVTVIPPTATDNCGRQITATTSDPLTYNGQGNYTITWTYNDGNGQTVSQTQEVIVADTTDPTVPNLADVNVGQCSGTPPTPTTTDNCAGPITGTTATTFPITSQGTTVVTWTFDDGNGNIINVNQNVIVDDTTNPVRPTLANITGQCSATPPIPTTTDVCSGTITGTTTTIFPITAQGTTVVTWTFDDGNGNSINVNQNVILNDTTKPIRPTLSPINVGQCSGTPPIPTTTDACVGIVYGTTSTPFPINAQGTKTVTWTFDDGNGNSITANQSVIVDDTIAPVADLATLPTLRGECSVTVVTTPTATDNCKGQITGTTTNPTTYSSQGTFTITWRYNDLNGNTSTQTQSVVVNDTTAPVPDVTDLPTLTGECSVTNIVRPTATDNCRGQLTATTSNPTSYTSQGTYTITWRYNDSNGNITTQTQTVIVKDNTAPVANVTNLPTITGQCSVTGITRPTATDNCKGQITATTSNPLSYTVQGTYLITWIYNDTYGNTSSQTQTVVVQDTTAPVPNVATLPTVTGECSATVTAPKATDNCKGNITGTTSNPTTYTTQGTYTITWVYNDTFGNSSTQTQTVVVKDTTAPVANVTFLPNINVQCSVTLTVPTATDNCRGTITATTSDPLTYNSQGDYTITWTYNDGYGNSSNQNQLVSVKDTVFPLTPSLPDLAAECSLTVTRPTTTDNCAGTITGTTGLNSLTFNTVGTEIIYWDFTDGAGNSVIVPQNITITDTPPVPNASVLNPQVFNGCQIMSINSLVAPTATDVCDGQIVGTLSPNFVFPFAFSGTRTIDWEFIDSHGNVTIQPQDITLNPINVDGGIMKGTFQSTVFSDGIDISSCAVAISVDLNLSGQIGTIIQWEKFAVNQGVWQVIPNTTNNYTASFGVGALISTYYRVLVRTGTCSTYSNQFLIRALPTGSAPTITNLDADAFYCLGEEVRLLATSNYTATQETIPDSAGDFNQGQLNTRDPDGWLVDGDPGGFTAGGSATKPRNWSGKTCNNQANGDIVYCGTDGKFSIAYGDFSSNQYKGNKPTTFETPILDFSNATTASLDFDQAFYFANGDYANIEISTSGGAPGTYTALRLMHAPGSGILKWFTAGTAASVAGSDATHYNFETDNTSIDLSAYLGQSNIRIRWSFTGTNTKSVWALDNIFVNKTVVVDTELEWTDGIGNPGEPPFAGGQTQVAFNFTPDAPGHHQYGTTALVNNCRTYDTDGTALIDIFVSYSYAGQNVTYLSQDCGQNTVRLNAYDNKKSAKENANKGAFTLPANCLNCNDAGTGEKGTWSISNNSVCGGGTFSDINDPDAVFTGEAGTYTLTWTVAGCTSFITVTTTNCNQIDFDGNNDYVDFDANNFNFNSGNFSIEGWVKPKSFSGTQTIFSKRNGNDNNVGYDLSVDNTGEISFNVNQSFTLSSAPYKITTDRWYHIAISYIGNRYRLYVDGIDIQTKTGNRPGSNNFKALLGAMDDNSSNKPKKHFNGWIDEFRVWNVGLTPDQLHQMMNQKIVPSTIVSGNVQGETIPVDIAGLSWSNLSAYFQMEPDQVACGYLLSTSSLIKGKLKNITSSETQTAPIPYTSRANGPWETNTTWTNFQVWDAPNSIGIDGSTRIDWNIVKTNHNIVSSTKDLTVLGLMVDSNNLTISGAGPQDETNQGTALWVTHYLKLNGYIDLVGESQLVQKAYNSSQVSESVLDVRSSGKIGRDQQGTADKFTYNYWASPVGVSNITSNNNSYRVKDIMKDGAQNITWLTTGYNGTNGSPIGIADYWIWKYANLPDNSYASWQHVRSTGTMSAGQGFTMKGPGTGSIATKQNYLFTGKPNNGDIDLTISAGNDYLVGNPYPSAIDGRQFILDNGDVIDGDGSTTGTLYFWEHWGGGSHVLAQYQGGYATYNLSGGSPSASFGTNDPLVGTGGVPKKKPGRYIPVGQGFFVVAEGNGGTIKFRNDQRIFKREGSTSVFMRQSAGSTVFNDNPDDEDNRMKFRIGFNSVNTIHRQLLLTIDDNATDDIDWGYDAAYIDNQMDDMYWMIKNEKFTIQGRDAVTKSSVVPLGLHLKTAGQNKISIDLLENVPNDLDLFVHDKVLDLYHNLRKSPYVFNLPAGTYLDRFELRFQEGSVLNVKENDFTALEIYYTNTFESLVLVNPTLLNIKRIELFNIMGQSICTIKPNENKTYSEYKVKNLSTGTYIVKVITDNGTTSKKVLVK